MPPSRSCAPALHLRASRNSPPFGGGTNPRHQFPPTNVSAPRHEGIRGQDRAGQHETRERSLLRGKTGFRNAVGAVRHSFPTGQAIQLRTSRSEHRQSGTASDEQGQDVRARFQNRHANG